MSGLVDPNGQPYGPNRQVRRQVLRELARPEHDLICTRINGSDFIYVGLRGSGYVRLDHHKARQLLDELAALVDSVEDAGGPEHDGDGDQGDNQPDERSEAAPDR